ncbi:MAG: glycosyltransferase family 87 protein [Pseudolabrys sp.]
MAIHRDEANRDVLQACAILGAFFVVATAGAYLYRLDWNPDIPRDGSTLVIGRDFLNIWMYGVASSLPDPGQWYDPRIYQRALASFLGDGYPGQNWSYPPSLLLLAAPFGRLGYLPALACWTLIGVAIYAVAVFRRFAGWRALVAALCAPAAIFCIISGQSSLITAAMLLGIFALLDRRPLVAGVLIGLLTLKPQLGILFPVMLIASSRWRVFTAAAVIALALAALSAALFGPQAWIDFVMRGLPVQNIVLADPERIATPFYPTLFMNLRGIGVTYQTAMAVQIVVAFGAAAIVAWAFRARAQDRIAADPRQLAALFFACSIAAVPYLLSYDTLPLCLAALSLMAADELDRRGRWLTRLIYWLPLLQIGLGTFHIPGPALIAPAFALYMFVRLKNQPTEAAQPLPQPA